MPPAIWTTWHQLQVKKSENLNEVMNLSFHLQTVCNSQKWRGPYYITQSTWVIPTLTQTATSNRSTANPTTAEPPSSLLLPLHLVPSLPLDPPVPRDLNANLSGLDEGPRGIWAQAFKRGYMDQVPRRVPRSWKCEHRLVFTHDFPHFFKYDLHLSSIYEKHKH